MPNAVAPPTIAAIATPPGRGGVGIVRVSGTGLDPLIEGLVGIVPPPRVATVATFRDGQGAPLDQGLALYFPAPASYTGETVVELHGHGGPSVLRLVLARCVELGARLAEPGEFTKRAFLNGKLDLAQAESVADLIDAATATAARAAARSLSGVFSAQVHRLVEALTELRMYTEATLDFPEEDIEFLRAGDVVAKLKRHSRELAEVLARAKTGALLREGLTVVLVGRPNVGKSSLLNALAREEAAIVTPVAGTTRDTVERRVEIAGIPLTVVDTAGLRDTEDPVETIGIERTWAAVERADLVLLLVDARADADALDAEDRAILARLPTSIARVVVHNKADLACVAPAAAHSRRRGRRAPPRLAVCECRRRRRPARTGSARGNRRRGHDRGHVSRPRTSRAGIAPGVCAPHRRRGAGRARSHRLSSSSPRSCGKRRPRCPRSPASSRRTTCWASSSGVSALANSAHLRRRTSR